MRYSIKYLMLVMSEPCQSIYGSPTLKKIATLHLESELLPIKTNVNPEAIL